MEIIQVKYKPLPLFNWTRTVTKKIPGRWYEASGNDLLSISRYLCQVTNNSRFVSEFVGIPSWVTSYISEFELWSVAQCITLIDKREPIDRMLIDSFQAGNIKLLAPKPLLKDVTFGNFVFFDSYYTDFIRGNMKALDKMISYLYIPDSGEQHSEVLHNLTMTDYAIKYAIYINYNLMREWLAVRYGYIFTKRKQAATQKNEKNNWLPILDSIIANDIANADKYEQLPVHTVLRMLNNKLKEGYKHG